MARQLIRAFFEQTRKGESGANAGRRDAPDERVAHVPPAARGEPDEEQAERGHEHEAHEEHPDGGQVARAAGRHERELRADGEGLQDDAAGNGQPGSALERVCEGDGKGRTGGTHKMSPRFLTLCVTDAYNTPSSSRNHLCRGLIICAERRPHVRWVRTESGAETHSESERDDRANERGAHVAPHLLDWPLEHGDGLRPVHVRRVDNWAEGASEDLWTLLGLCVGVIE